MDHAKVENHMGLGNHPYFQFNAAIERLEEEHRVLGESLLELCTIVEALDYKKDITNWVKSMTDLKQKINEFKQALERHSNWEEDELFKLVDKYFDEIPSLFGLIEQEHELVEKFMNAFITVVDQNILAINPKDAAKMGAYLQLALSSLLAHFKKEEDIVASLADFSNQYGY
jgi:iron-sulfur cluster repair protein YtfE (RIC family)